jgi:hypothetical protein
MMELVFDLSLIFVPIYLLDKELLGLIYKLYVPVSTLVACIYISVPIFNTTTEIRRVGGGAFQLSGAVNNIALMFTIAIAIAVIGLLFLQNTTFQLINSVSICLLVPGLLITGSRRMIIGGGVLIVAFIMAVRWIEDVRFGDKMKYALIFMIFSLVILLILYDFSGVSRYSVGSIVQSLVIRITEHFTPTLNQMTFSIQEILFGAGMFRYGLVAVGLAEEIVYPHNFLLSFFVHTGLPTAIVLLAIVVSNVRYLISSIGSDSHSQYLILSTLLSLLLILIYISLGGRITRSFTFYIFLGFSEYLYISEIMDGSRPLLYQ